MARAQRQLTEIVAEAVCGHRRRFHALALEHLAERPDDRDLVTAGEIIQASTPRPIP